MRQTAVAGGQKRFTRCFRVFEVARHHKKNSQNRKNIYFTRESIEHSKNDGCITCRERKKLPSLEFAVLAADDISAVFFVVAGDAAENKITFL